MGDEREKGKLGREGDLHRQREMRGRCGPIKGGVVTYDWGPSI